MTEISSSTTKRSLGDAVQSLNWSQQFREIALKPAIIDMESLREPLYG